MLYDDNSTVSNLTLQKLNNGNKNTVTWYDDYNFPGSQDYGFDDYPLAGFTLPQALGNKGRETATLTRVFDNMSDVTADNLLLKVTWYDKYGRPIRIISDNHPGGKDVVYNNYNFSGQITESTTIHNYGDANSVQLATTFMYDHQGRLTSERLKINQQDEITLASYKYNDLGELIAKYLHGTDSGSNFNQKTDYSYNVKGWLQKINNISEPGNDLFAMEISYNDNGTGYYNGNIRKVDWLNQGNIPKSYTFTCDGVNRIQGATYSDLSGTGAFDTGYTYDDNGNITTLARKSNSIQIDDLTYSYHSGSNRLKSVNDVGTTAGYHAAGGMYEYDSNGNMTTDPSKGTTITYNQLNLPEEVSFGAGDYVRYLYDAPGYKLAKVVDGTVSADNTRIDYSGSFLYENGELKTIFTGEGRIIPFDNNGAVGYKYLFQDKNVPKGQGYSRFAQKRTSMNGFSGSIVRFFVATDCFTALGCYDYLFVERYNQLGMYYPFKKRTVSH